MSAERLRIVLNLVFVTLGGLALICLPCSAQDRLAARPAVTQVTIQTNSAAPTLSAPSSSVSTTPPFELKQAEQPREINIGKKWRIGGPLVSIFKGGKIRQAPGRFFRAINPFRHSSEESSTTSEVEFERYQDISPRAWSTSVGWHPTRSGPPDPVNHEGGITLIDMSPRDRLR